MSGWVTELGISLSEDDRAFQAELEGWLDEHLPPDWGTRSFRFPEGKGGRVRWLRAWQSQLAEGRWVAISWPVEHGGRAATPLQLLLFHAAMAARKTPFVIGQSGLSLCGPTLIAHGTPEQQQRFLPAMRTAEHVWCQGFSEPDAGSDLASLKTKGVVDGDELVITGQKIWTSYANVADWMFALIRTSPDAPKRQGISFVLVPMDAPGVTVRPIVQISGDKEFSEVFLDEVRVPLGNVVGRLHDGWNVARTTLANERVGVFMAAQAALGRVVQQVVVEAKTERHGRRKADDPKIRERIARAWVDTELVRINGTRNLARVVVGGDPGPEGSMAKLFGQELEQRVFELALDVGGIDALLTGEEGADRGKRALGWLRTRGSTIGGGTSEIQRNILAERVLGQPRDPWADE